METPTTTGVAAPHVTLLQDPDPTTPAPTTAPPTTTPPAKPSTTRPSTTTPTTKPPVASPSPSQPKPTSTTESSPCPQTGFGGVEPHVARAAWHIVGKFRLNPDLVYGVAGRAGTSDHPVGLAVDFMVYTNKDLGDRIASYVIDQHNLLAVKYVIWQQRIAQGPDWGWKQMADRGGTTANHYDHVHVSFLATGSGGAITC